MNFKIKKKVITILFKNYNKKLISYNKHIIKYNKKILIIS